MKIEFRFNGDYQIHLTPENADEDYFLTAFSKRCRDRSGVGKISGSNDEIDGRISMVISVEK